tara:strand:+ start:1097 stop:1441 length:345 start_codon:yes stop_codon:yes gene_type:complete
MIEKITVNITIKGRKNLLACLVSKRIKNIEKTNSNKGILFPERIIAVKKIMNKTGITYFENCFDFSVKNRGRTKKENKENRWINPPAINSSPNGPLNFLSQTVSNPKISWPNLY